MTGSAPEAAAYIYISDDKICTDDIVCHRLEGPPACPDVGRNGEITMFFMQFEWSQLRWYIAPPQTESERSLFPKKISIEIPTLGKNHFSLVPRTSLQQQIFMAHLIVVTLCNNKKRCCWRRREPPRSTLSSTRSRYPFPRETKLN